MKRTSNLPSGGSSPRAWGTRHAHRRHQQPARFIPTCVGNTLTHGQRFSLGTVHPHVRGEHVEAAVADATAVGSSPRAWGTHQTVRSGARRNRFIPTCVGNTACRTSPIASTPVHPHVRGEHLLFQFLVTQHRGSSPRAWGTPDHAVGRSSSSRFIPTCVGNTLASMATCAAMSVHPHVRGEHSRRPRWH